MDIIIAGSEGLVGKVLVEHFEKNHCVKKLDLLLGHDLTNEEFVKDWFSNNHGDSLINLFAIDDTVSDKRKSLSFTEIDLNLFNKVMSVNVTAMLSTCREFIRNNVSGKIVNFSSIYGIVSPQKEIYTNGEKFIGYGVSKAAIIQLTRHLAAHAPKGFFVNSVSPGGIYNGQPTDFIKNYSDRLPLKRMMNPHELIGIVEYLVSENCTYTTGANHIIDGGWTIL